MYFKLCFHKCKINDKTFFRNFNANILIKFKYTKGFLEFKKKN